MANKIFVASIIGLWLTSMTWLVSERILPSFGGGDPPFAEDNETGKAVAWRVECGGKNVGEAASVRLAGAAGTIDVHNRLRLKNFPLMELAPTWMRLAVGEIGDMTFDAITRIEFDPLGNFSSFTSNMSLNERSSVIKLSGRIVDSYLELNVRAGTFSHMTPVFLPDSKALNESLFPAAKLRNLQEGRSWQEEVYSPFSTPGNPVELVRAKVVGREQIEYVGAICPVFRVEYRRVSGSSVPDKARLLAVSWVELHEGDVLRRDVYVGQSRLRFERVSDAEAEIIGAKLFEQILRARKTLS